MARHGTSPRGAAPRVIEAHRGRRAAHPEAITMTPEKASQKRLAGEFGVSRSAIGGIAQGGTLLELFAVTLSGRPQRRGDTTVTLWR